MSKCLNYNLMKRCILLLAALTVLVSACHKDEPTEEKVSKKEINLTVSDAVAYTTSLDINISASGVYLSEFNTWGILVSKSSDKSGGVEVKAVGRPRTDKVQIQVADLEPDMTYYVWGWAEGLRQERIWSRYYVPVKTKAEGKPMKLVGSVIGSQYSVDYSTSLSSTTVNTKDNVFDGNYDTFFASYDRSNTWVGLDLGVEHIITKVGYSPRTDQEGRVELAVIEGASKPDFSDALPIHVVRNSAPSRVMTYDEVSCSRGFRYVRYVTPNDARCNLAELEFYGYEGVGDDSALFQLTNLPMVVINTQYAKDIVSKEVEIPANVYIISEDGTNLLATSETAVRGRGNASWNFDKKPYRLKFKDKQSPLGAPASAKKWTLISNYGDKTLMRNILAYQVSRCMGMAFTPFIQPVDVFLNGEYKGCYQFCDQVEAAEGRVPAKNGYHIEVDGYAWQEESMFWSWTGTPVTIKNPDEDDITQEQKDFISNFFSMMEQAALSDNFTDPENGYRKYLDLDSFLSNFIIGDFCGNEDMFWSIHMYKDMSDGKIFTGPTWDHDLSFDNDYRSYPINSLNDFLLFTKANPAGGKIAEVARRIIKEDPEAKKRLIELWEAGCEAGIKDLKAYAEQTAELLDESQELNFKRWKILDQYIHMNFQALGSYEAEVDFVKQFIDDRLVLFDQLVRQ